MFYCPTCKNTYDISKDIIKLQQGKGLIDYDKVVTDVNDPSIIELVQDSKFDMDGIFKSTEFKKLSKAQKEFVVNKIAYLLPNNKKEFNTEGATIMTAYFHCKNCSNTEQIQPGTKIYSVSSDSASSNYNSATYGNMIYSDILPITRKYKCENEKCISHKDVSKREAKFFRLNNSYKTKLICLACETIF
jgi:hypothetical protein